MIAQSKYTKMWIWIINLLFGEYLAYIFPLNIKFGIVSPPAVRSFGSQYGTYLISLKYK